MPIRLCSKLSFSSVAHVELINRKWVDGVTVRTLQLAKWVGDFVHESVQVHGRLGHLESNLLHFTCDSLSEHLRTMDRYTTLAAEQLVDQKTRVGWTQLALDPPWTFFKTYVVRRGFLDGDARLQPQTWWPISAEVFRLPGYQA